jgi:sulfur-oxidizing protein SoxY
MSTPYEDAMNKNLSRRWFLSAITATAALAILPLRLLARSTSAFKANDTDLLANELFGDLPIEDSDAISFRAPDIAENGAVVPVTISTEIEGVKQICIIVDKNPNPLSAIFNLSEHSMADISTRIKIGDSSMVHAMVKTSDRVYRASKEVKVTIGGCGG